MQIQLWLETITNRVLSPMQNISLMFHHSKSYVSALPTQKEEEEGILVGDKHFETF